MPLDPSIALQFKPAQAPQTNALAQYGQVMQIQQAQMQMDKLRKTDEALERVRQISMQNGGPENLGEIARAYMQAPDAAYQKFGYEILQQQRDKELYEQYLRNQGVNIPTLGGGAASGAASGAAPGAAPATPSPANAMVAPGMAPATAPVNAMAAPGTSPAAPAAAPVNAMARRSPQAILNDIRMLSRSTYPGAKAEVDVLKAQLAEMTKVPSAVAEFEYGRINPEFNAWQLAQKNAGAARSITNVNAYTPASEEAQKDFIKSSGETYRALKQVQPVLDNIEKAKALIPAAKGFMGAGGEGFRQAASFLNNRLGTNIDTKGVKAVEELRSRLFMGIMDNLKKLDAQPSQQQQAALQQALGSIENDPNALASVLDVFGDTLRGKVDLHNQEVGSAIERGVKFPYDPVIKLKPKAPPPGSPAAATTPAPAGVDAALWNVMTPQERALWPK